VHFLRHNRCLRISESGKSAIGFASANHAGQYEWAKMKLKFMLIAGLASSLTACATTGGGIGADPISSAWVGRSAGKFFAAYGPPLSDDGTGSVFVWKGGYKRVHGDLKSCSASIAVTGDYNIRSITITGDRKGEISPSYCRELLAPDSVKATPAPVKPAKAAKTS
jgi:hypothetical protein